MRLVVCALLTVAAFVAQGVSAQGNPNKVDTASAEFREDRALRNMRNDLRNLVAAEETYFADHARYTASLKALAGGLESQGQPYPTPGDSMPRITLVGRGWTATIRNPNTRKVCAVFVGTKTPIPPATKEGSPACG